MKRSIIMDFGEAFIVLVLISLMLLMLSQVRALQGTARVVNYTGIVRGATQRLIKLELMRQQNRDLEHHLDGIIEDLQNEHPGMNELILLPDDRYKQCLSALAHAWTGLKQALMRLRSGEPVDNVVLELSEVYFTLADTTVSAAEDYSQSLAGKIQTYERFTMLVMAIEVLLIICKSVKNIALVRHNIELGRMAYVDAHTGLPNKSRCEQFMNDQNKVPAHTTVFMFDLNYLKRVNDELGHDAGDSLIKHFAMLLRNNIPSRHFIGRFGGDEFIVVAHDITQAEIDEITRKLEEAKNRFNATDQGYTLSYSCGYAMSDDFIDCTYKTLFDKADFNMYENKRSMKAALGNEDLR